MKKLFLSLLMIISFMSFAHDDSSIIKIAQNIYSEWSSHAQKKTVIIIDFSKPMESDRLYVVDLSTNQIVLKTKVCHGVGSGKQSIPSSFSNTPNSLQSSKGVMVTAETYNGQFGYSLKLDGLQKCNSNVRSRSIIIHNSSVQRTPWSWGCFSIPQEYYKKVIDLTKGGSLLFVFSNPDDLK